MQVIQDGNRHFCSQRARNNQSYDETGQCGYPNNNINDRDRYHLKKHLAISSPDILLNDSMLLHQSAKNECPSCSVPITTSAQTVADQSKKIKNNLQKIVKGSNTQKCILSSVTHTDSMLSHRQADSNQS